MKSHSPIRWPGGKSLAAKTIVERFPSGIKHFIDSMVGGGSISFYLLENNLIDGMYYLADKNEELMNFYRVLRDTPQALINVLRVFHDFVQRHENPKQAVKDLRDLGAEDLVEASAIFFMLNRLSYSGSTRSGGITDYAVKHRFTESSINKLKHCSDLLNRKEVFIGYKDVLDPFSYESQKDSFYYLDPPYYGVDGLYGNKGDLSKFDHVKLAEKLKSLDSRFLLSYNDCDKIRDLYGWAEIEPLTLPYSMGKKKKGAEVLIKNYADH